MPISAALLSEFDYEMANTRKTLERLPDDKLGFKPHEKSGTMGWLATHVSFLPSWLSTTLQQDHLDLADPANHGVKELHSREEILKQFDKYVQQARAALAAATDEQMMGNWRLHSGEQTFFSMPRVAVLRGFVMNHLIHHRGQLTVYLRLNNVAVPALYGPSADESPF